MGSFIFLVYIDGVLVKWTVVSERHFSCEVRFGPRRAEMLSLTETVVSGAGAVDQEGKLSFDVHTQSDLSSPRNLLDPGVAIVCLMWE